MVSEGRSRGRTAGLFTSLLLPSEVIFSGKFSGYSILRFGAQPVWERGCSCEARKLFLNSPHSCLSWLGGLTQHGNGIASHQPFLEIMGWTKVDGSPGEVARAGDTTQLGWLNLCKPLHLCSFAHWGSPCMLG